MTRDTVRNLVLQYGWNATAYQILNPGFSYWLNKDGTAVAGYVQKGRWWLVAGAPVCAADNLAVATKQLEQHARRKNCKVCYVCAAERMRGLFAESKNHSILTIGAEPVWRPADWAGIVAARSSLRAQLNRAKNKGVCIEKWDDVSAGRLDSLRKVIAEWLGRKGLPPMHFLTEPDILHGEMRDRLLFVATRDNERGGREPVAFLVASPVPTRKGYLVEEIARGKAAPNGVAELLIDAAMREMAKRGAIYATLGLVALSTQTGPIAKRNPAWVRTLMLWARAHGRRFYNFDGLEQFRTKMTPAEWEPIYAITNERRFSPAALHAVAQAFCDESPAMTLVRAIGRAVRQESKWGIEKLKDISH